jgi:hypothetical protein
MGSSLVSAIETGRTADAPVVAERVMFADDYQATLRSEASRVIFHAREGLLQAFDRTADPAEQHDVAWQAPWFGAAARGLGRALQQVFALRGALDAEASGAPQVLSPQEVDELARLGYTGRDVDASAGTPLASWPADRLEDWVAPSAAGTDVEPDEIRR